MHQKNFAGFLKKKFAPTVSVYRQIQKSNVKELAIFAAGLEKDLEAVENAVVSDLSNGFVEGVNNKT